MILCAATTNSCGGHGQCHRKYADKDSSPGSDCWSCRCMPSVQINATRPPVHFSPPPPTRKNKDGRNWNFGILGLRSDICHWREYFCGVSRKGATLCNVVT